MVRRAILLVAVVLAMVVGCERYTPPPPIAENGEAVVHKGTGRRMAIVKRVMTDEYECRYWTDRGFYTETFQAYELAAASQPAPASQESGR